MPKLMEKGTKHDTGKPRFDLIDWSFIRDVAAVLEYGCRKYAPDNWKAVPDGRSRYFGAAHRHLAAWASGEEKDEESGLPHLAHATCNIMFLAFFKREPPCAS